MSLIDRAATFRGRIVDHVVNKSTNDYPQWVAQLVAVEIYDEEEKVWKDWSEYDVNEITAYLVLFGSKGETLTCQQVKKITNWDGISFFETSGLSNMDLSEVNIQFRVEENTYEGKTKLQVSWIDEYNAKPGRTVRKLKPEEMKALDAQYAKFLKQSGKKVAPAKPSKVTAEGIKPTQPKGPVKKNSKDPLGPPTATTSAPKTPAVPQDPSLPVGHCTKDEAWAAVNDLKAKKYTDEQIANTWLGALQEVAPGTEQENVTDEQWYLVKEKVMKKTAQF